MFYQDFCNRDEQQSKNMIPAHHHSHCLLYVYNSSSSSSFCTITYTHVNKIILVQSYFYVCCNINFLINGLLLIILSGLFFLGRMIGNTPCFVLCRIRVLLPQALVKKLWLWYENVWNWHVYRKYWHLSPGHWVKSMSRDDITLPHGFWNLFPINFLQKEMLSITMYSPLRLYDICINYTWSEKITATAK